MQLHASYMCTDIVCNYMRATCVQILYATTCELHVYRYCMQLHASYMCTDIVCNIATTCKL